MEGIRNPQGRQPAKGAPVRAYISAAYLSVVWLTYRFTIPVGELADGLPIYVLISPLMLLVLPRAAVVAFCLGALLLAYECLKFVQADFEPTSKGFAGLLVLAMLLPLCYHALRSLASMSDRAIGIWLRLLLILLLAGMMVDQALGLAGITSSEYPHYFLPIERRSGFYTEPSFLALAIGPFVYLAMHNLQMFKRYLGNESLLILAAIIILAPSATMFAVILLAGCVVAAKFILRGSALGIVGSAIAVVVVVVLIAAVPEVAERFAGVLSGDAGMDDQNMSALVFTKGRQMATYAIMHMPLGVSFLDMIVLVRHSDAAYLNNVIRDLNSADGSSILFKGVSELGILFIAVSLIALWRFLRALVADKGDSLFGIFILSLQFSAFCHYIRGASYFDGIVIVGLSIMALDWVCGPIIATRRDSAPARGAPKTRPGRLRAPARPAYGRQQRPAAATPPQGR